jgi:putative hydrolase of the HAD superfamily
LSHEPSVTGTVFVDADNTLWDTDAVFAHAQLDLLAAIERATGISTVASDRLAFVREIDQHLAERHHQGLRYPPRLLARATAFALTGISASRAAKKARLGDLRSPLGEGVEVNIEQAFFAEIGKPAALRPGVIEGLDRLLHAGLTVLIVTESAEEKVAATAERLGLNGHFSRIIEGKKRPELYLRIIRLATNGAEGGFMIGDQLDRDIAPAKEAGLTTIYFPSGFQPRWMPDEADVRPDFKIQSFDEVPIIVAECLARPQRERHTV